MARSILLDGILTEDPEAARLHVWSYDHANVFSELWRRGITHKKMAPKDPIRHAREDGLILPIEPNDWRAAKLNRILNRLGLRFESEPSEAELVDLCLRAEIWSVELLRRLEGKQKSGRETFKGDTVLDLSRFILRRIFEEIDQGFSSKSQAEKARIAEDIARRISELPPDLQERIRSEAGLASLSADAIMTTGSIAAVGGAMVGTVGLAGFAAYTTVTSSIATAAGLLGLTLPFGAYTFATSALAFLSNPLVLAGAIMIGGPWAIIRANHQMHDRLLPIMVATSVIAAVGPGGGTIHPTGMVRRLKRAPSLRAEADKILRKQIESTFPALPKLA